MPRQTRLPVPPDEEDRRVAESLEEPGTSYMEPFCRKKWAHLHLCTGFIVQSTFSFSLETTSWQVLLVTLTLENISVDFYNILYALCYRQWHSSPHNCNDSTTGSTTNIWVSRHGSWWGDTSRLEKWKILLVSPAHIQAPKVPLTSYQRGARKDNLSPERQPSPCQAPSSDVLCCLHQDNRHHWKEGCEGWCLPKYMFKLR